jgi:hypothetical protein
MHRLTFYQWPSPTAQLTLWHSGDENRHAALETLQRVLIAITPSGAPSGIRP